MTLITTLLSIAVAILAIAFMVIRVTKAPIYGLLAKTVASMGLVAMGTVAVVLADGNLPYGAPLIVLGLAFSMVGDIVLDLKRAHSEFEDTYLTSGMLAFSVAHAAYISAIVLIAQLFLNDPTSSSGNVWLPALISALIAIAAAPVVMIVSQKTMNAKYGKFFGISMGYAALLIFTTVFTIWLTVLDIRFLLVAIGMLLFLLSDLVLSVNYFVEGNKENKLLVVANHSLYYGAQILIACFLFSLIGA